MGKRELLFILPETSGCINVPTFTFNTHSPNVVFFYVYSLWGEWKVPGVIVTMHQGLFLVYPDLHSW